MGASTAADGGARAFTAARARSFAAAETASGLARFPGLSPPAYGSVYLRARLPFMVPMCSVLPFPPVGLGFHFRGFLAPMRSAVSAQVFLFGLKTSFSGNAQDPLAEAIAALRLYLTDLRAWRSGVPLALNALSS